MPKRVVPLFARFADIFRNWAFGDSDSRILLPLQLAFFRSLELEFGEPSIPNEIGESYYTKTDCICV